MQREKNFLSIIVYVKNDEKSIGYFLSSMDAWFGESFEFWEFILVNDFSEDETLSVVKSVAKDIKGNISVVNLAWRHGVETSIIAGQDLAIGDYLLEFDSTVIDFNLDEIMNLYNKCQDGFDIVAASSSQRLPLSTRFFYKSLEHISRKKMNLTTENFRIITRRALNRIKKFNEKIRYRKAIYHYSGLNTSVITYGKIEAGIKRKKVPLFERISLGLDVFIAYSSFAAKISMYISAVSFVLVLFTVYFTIHSYFTEDNLQRGWTTIMLFLSGGFFGVFLFLALISKYLVNILIELQGQEPYSYKSVDRYSNR